MPIMPFIFGAGAIASIVRWVVATLGVGIVSIVGLSALLTQLTAYVGSLSLVPAIAVDAFCTMQVQGCISIILSAYAIRVAISAGKRFRVL